MTNGSVCNFWHAVSSQLIQCENDENMQKRHTVTYNEIHLSHLISSHLCMVEGPLNIPDSPLHGPHSAECCLDSSSSSPPKNPLKGTSGQDFWEKDLYNLRNKFEKQN